MITGAEPDREQDRGDLDCGNLDRSDLDSGDLELTGRIPTASNATFRARVGATSVVYKPVSG